MRVSVVLKNTSSKAQFRDFSAQRLGTNTRTISGQGYIVKGKVQSPWDPNSSTQSGLGGRWGLVRGLPRALGGTRGLCSLCEAVNVRTGVFRSKVRPYRVRQWRSGGRWGMVWGGRWRYHLCPITRYSPVRECNTRTRRRAAMNFLFINTIQVRR